MQTGRYLTLFACLMLLCRLNATHNRAGEITYERIPPYTIKVAGIDVNYFKFRIRIITYTDASDGSADRCILDSLYFGDGDKGVATRINGPANGCCDGTGCCAGGGQPIPCGEIIINNPGGPKYIVKKNVYIAEHVFPGTGSFRIRCIDPNRNAGIYNIPNSVGQPFYIESLLIINNFTGPNNSPVLHHAPIDKACAGQCFQHNPAAYDADGDSLSYEISTCRGADGKTVPGYSFPNAGTSGTYSINAVTGLISWCAPAYPGEYNIAFIVKEWRKGTNANYQLIGTVLRDMQVIVGYCPNQNPPVIKTPADTCVEAGSLVIKQVVVSDEDKGDVVVLAGVGGAFSASTPVATLTNTTGVITNSNSALVSVFRWQTDCNHIRLQPYFTTFKAQDNGKDVKQVAFGTYAIRVMPPSVKNLAAVPEGGVMKVSWSLSSCNPAGNPITAYKIYRKSNCSPFTPDPCLAKIPASSGYVLIGETGPSTGLFVDNNAGDGLVVGQDYSYMVAAVYSDGSQSYASSQVCARLKRDVPVILNVDVLSTHTETGSIKVVWEKPLTTPAGIDTLVYKGPYHFILKHRDASGNYSPVFSTAKNSIGQLETLFVHNNINTALQSHVYAVEFVCNGTTIGFSNRASSVFLVTKPSDRRMDLSWSAKTPWSNYKYSVYRKNPAAPSYSMIATTTLNAYTDADKVVNGYNYCYYVVSEGAYSDTGIVRPLLNNSQQACAQAKDLTAPCPPTLTGSADCPANFVKIGWNNVKTLCDGSDDVINYNLFYKPSINGEYSPIATITEKSVREFIPDDPNLLSGCYAIQSVDSSGNKSLLSPQFCVDNCPLFELPDIFTPNGDNVNDYFKAIQIRQIKEIDLVVFDRWGSLVYKTKDPYFKWDGLSAESKLPVSEGAFFYLCHVFEPHLGGVAKRTIKGSVQVVR